MTKEESLNALKKAYNRWFNIAVVTPIAFGLFCLVLTPLLIFNANSSNAQFIMYAMFALLPAFMFALIGYVIVYFVSSHSMFEAMQSVDSQHNAWMLTIFNLVSAFFGIPALFFGVYVLLKIREIWKNNHIEYDWNLKAKNINLTEIKF